VAGFSFHLVKWRSRQSPLEGSRITANGFHLIISARVLDWHTLEEAERDPSELRAHARQLVPTADYHSRKKQQGTEVPRRFGDARFVSDVDELDIAGVRPKDRQARRAAVVPTSDVIDIRGHNLATSGGTTGNAINKVHVGNVDISAADISKQHMVLGDNSVRQIDGIRTREVCREVGCRVKAALRIQDHIGVRVYGTAGTDQLHNRIAEGRG
jgi:hypothetical protein